MKTDGGLLMNQVRTPPDIAPALSDEMTPFIDGIGTSGFFEKLHAALKQIASFQNFIVLLFETGRTAEVLHTNLELTGLLKKMTPYLNGLYELDPFFIAGASGDERNFIVMDEVAPEEFTQTEFYRSYYTTIDLTQETRFIVPLRPARWIHVLVEREPPEPQFAAQERVKLRGISKAVASLTRKHYEFSVVAGRMPSTNRALATNLFAVISQLGAGTLSNREVQVTEGLLQGHSPKSVAQRLDISVRTVANHKRHIYEKLRVHSQAQLFNMVLAALLGDSDKRD